MGTLYLVGTPIGNLEDISLRALRILDQVSLIAAEDTRRASILAQRYELHTPITSYFEGNKRAKTSFTWAWEVEKEHEALYRAALAGLNEPQEDYEFYVCPVCGHTHPRSAPDRCPVCGAPGARFEKIS